MADDEEAKIQSIGAISHCNWRSRSDHNSSETMTDESQHESSGTKRLGFQFKGTSKRQKIVTGEVLPERDVITAIEGSNINSAKPTKAEEVLVIPLVQPRVNTTSISVQETAKTSSNASTKGDAGKPQTLDEIAEAELLAELNQKDRDANNPYDSLVIKQVTTDPSTSGDATGKKKAPLLMLNVAPELLSITNENDRFKYDVSSRAEDLNVRSEIYEAIPVGQFGAALLRGMGWQGPDKNEKPKKEEKLVAREKRLGLGAQARPPEKPKNTRGNALLPTSGPGGAVSDAEARKERERKRWELRAQQKLADQKLFDEDYVWLRAPADLSGRRAVIIAAQGVPGLDRVRIQLERSGRIVEVGRKDCVLLTPSELADKPFIEAQDSQNLRDEQLQRQSESQFKGLANSIEISTIDRNESKEKDKDTKKEYIRDDVKIEKSTSSSKNHNNNNSNMKVNNPAPAQQQQQVFWLREGIRVKVISKSVGGQRAYLQKGTVVDVYARGRASVRLDDNSVLDEVNERHVETIIPSVGGACIVLLGEHSGQHAVLVERRREEQRVMVQLSEDLDMIELDMDSIAATSR